jgi:hypothetical protein
MDTIESPPPRVEKTVLMGSRKHVIPPAILAVRMQRYSIYLMVLAFILLAVNYRALTVSSVLWYSSILCAVFGLLCAVAVTILNAIAWNFDRLLLQLKEVSKD